MRRFLVILIMAAAVFAVVRLLMSETEYQADATISVSDALRTDTTGYRRAVYPAEITFPDDHGAHPAFKTEWWYYTGNLASRSGRTFGYQFTIFRTALVPPAEVETGSSWRSSQLYTGHFAVSDPAAGRFLFAERSSRGAAGLAGATSEPFGVWLEDWSVRQAGEEAMAARLHAEDDGFAVDLRLDPKRPAILQGMNGFSPKASDSANASYYYSYTRLQTEGRLVVDADTFEVIGRTWMDHEWSTSALGPTQVGWDWFALRLSNGTDLMYFQVRERGGGSPFVEGTVRDSHGNSTRLYSENVRLEVEDRWLSPATAISYPSGWAIKIPDLELDVKVTPVMRDQELRLSIRYWEGAVVLSGSMQGIPVSGSGYVELTGYGDGTREKR